MVDRFEHIGVAPSHLTQHVKVIGVDRVSVKRIFDQALKAGELRPCDTAKLALFSTVALEGAILAAKASGDTQDYVDAIEMLIGYIQSYA